MPHFSLALMKGTEQQHYRTRSEIHRKVKWKKHRIFSLLAQMLSPLSTLFSIPALSEGWYIRKASDGSIVETKPDPPLIIAAGAILLALSVCSNTSILLRLLDVHSRLFTFTTVSILSVHIVLALVTVTIFAVERAQPDGYSLSTAFWLTVVSAIIALSVTTALLIDGFRTKWYSRGGTGLTGEQRSLVIVFNFFVINIIVGAIAYRYLIPNTNFLDSTYFTVQCLITVGFGDVLPSSASSQTFTIFFLSVGIVNFAILLAFIRSTALEALKERYKARERRALERIKTRHSAIVANHSRKTALLIYLTFGLYHPAHQQEATGATRTSASAESKSGHHERHKQKAYAYEEKIEELNRDQRLEFRSQLVIAIVGVLLTWFLGALVFMRLEGWSYGIAVYFSFVSSSTLGLGDYSPKTQGGRAFFCIWALLSAGILTVFFSVLADGYSAHYKETFQRNILTTLRKPKHKLHHSHEKPGGQTSEPERLPRSQTLVTNQSISQDLKSGEHVDITEKETPIMSRNERVSELLTETKLRLQHLATRDPSDTETIDLVVRRVMDEQEFAVRNRELVEQDKGLKEFIFLRNLLGVFDELETLTHELIDERDIVGKKASSKRVKGEDEES